MPLTKGHGARSQTCIFQATTYAKLNNQGYESPDYTFSNYEYACKTQPIFFSFTFKIRNCKGHMLEKGGYLFNLSTGKKRVSRILNKPISAMVKQIAHLTLINQFYLQEREMQIEIALNQK
ncbi:MAG: hypothetical protein AB1757_10900 [Acidobacteriota bacterium]